MRKKTTISLVLSCLLATTLLLGGCSKGKSSGSGGFNVLVLGQVGHGKSELTESIASAYDAKTKSAEELKSEGVVYHAASISVKSDSRKYNIYDFPEHGDVCKSIASKGITPDGAILVVSANDGPMAQTIEQLKLLKGLGIKNLVVYVSNWNDFELVIDDIKAVVGEMNFDLNKVGIITDSGDFSKENAKKVVSVMDKWTETNNKAGSVSGTSVEVYSYVLTKEEGGKNLPAMSGDELEITINNKTYKGKMNTPGVDMLMPGDGGAEIFELDGEVSAKAGDKVIAKKDGQTILVGVVFG